MDEIAVRWGSVEDKDVIARILGLNSAPEGNLTKETHIVAEARGEILAVARCLLARKRLVVGTPAVDPWAGKHRFAVALYSGAGELAREMGLREVWADYDEHREYLLEADYRRHEGGWRLKPIRYFDEYERFPERGWRRLMFLWGAAYVPFFRAFRA